MHFNIYIDDKTGTQITALAKNIGKPRNALIREAITEWLQRQQKPKWPPEVMAFTGIENFIGFESHRSDLVPPRQDSLA